MERPFILDKTLKHLQWSSIKKALSSECQSASGMDRALKLDFETELDAVRKRQAYTSEARKLIDEDMPLTIGTLLDIRVGVQRARRGAQIDPETLVAVGRLLETSRRVLDSLTAAREVPNLIALSSFLYQDRHFEHELLDAFDENLDLMNHASPQLRKLRQQAEECRTTLKRTLNRFLNDEDVVPMLQEDYFTLRDERFVLPVKARHKNHIEGIVHGWSKTGSTVYVEPTRVIEANNRLMLAQAETEAEINRVLDRLSSKVGTIAEPLLVSFDRLVELDLILAMGRFSHKLNAIEPTLSTDGHLDLKAFRHPLLLLDGQSVIPNSLTLNRTQPALVITGPNTGGKTVALKSAGLLVLMGHAGLHIPAALDSVIPLVPGVFSDIGDDQSLESRHSTFSGHIHNLNEIMAQIEPGALVLLDELVVGTDPGQGSALAQAISEYFVDQHCLLIVTTHYENLKCLALDDQRFRNGAMGLSGDTSVPTYSLTLDVPGASSALLTAGRLGLPAEIVKRASVLTDPHQRDVQKHLLRLDELQNQLQAERRLVRRREAELQKEHQRLTNRAEKLEQREAKLKANMHSALLADAQALRDRVKKQARLLNQNSANANRLKEAKSTAQEAIDHVFQTRQKEQNIKAGPEVDATAFKVGQVVLVLSVQRTGVIESIDTKKNRCTVRLGTISSRVDMRDLRLSTPGQRSSKKLKSQHWVDGKQSQIERSQSNVDDDWSNAGPQTTANTIDVRGLTVDECLEKAAKFMDACYLRNESAVFIIHGHGGGHLKRAVRNWLKACEYASAQRPGDRYEGGDGVTVARLT